MNDQLTLFDAQTIGAPYQPSSPTSIAAAVAARENVGPQKERIEDWLRVVGSGTQDEASIALDILRSACCARFRALELEGSIRKKDDTRPSRYGGKCAVYVLTDGGTK